MLMSHFVKQRAFALLCFVLFSFTNLGSDDTYRLNDKEEYFFFLFNKAFKVFLLLTLFNYLV